MSFKENRHIIKLRKLVNTALLGGLVVVIATALSVAVYKWIYTLITDFIQPITNIILKYMSAPEWVADMFALSILITASLGLGLLIHSRIGKPVHDRFVSLMNKVNPVFSMIHDMFTQLTSDNSPFKKGKPALINLYGPDHRAAWRPCLVMAQEGEHFRFYSPSSPTPNSGYFDFISGSDRVFLLKNVTVKELMTSIVSCGVVADNLFKEYIRLMEERDVAAEDIHGLKEGEKQATSGINAKA
ncbi:hypothetical protein [Neptuniibacter sp. QD37_11]|uniref:hypothetical protein n=1 Tax=Neptuniibacter sp. QD37_11 TaxID=3398209 RepID=UPI0039F5BD68